LRRRDLMDGKEVVESLKSPGIIRLGVRLYATDQVSTRHLVVL